MLAARVDDDVEGEVEGGDAGEYEYDGQYRCSTRSHQRSALSAKRYLK